MTHSFGQSIWFEFNLNLRSNKILYIYIFIRTVIIFIFSCSLQIIFLYYLSFYHRGGIKFLEVLFQNYPDEL